MKKLILTLMLFSSFAFSATSTCKNIYLNNELPSVKYDKEICFNKFAVLYNYNYKIPMVSAEHLTASDIAGSKSIKRHDAFHDESQIPTAYSEHVKDYKNTGFDRGHMTPAGDMPDKDSQFQSFSMSNMTPQTKKLNEITWRKIESNVRSQIEKYGEGYIVTGGIVSDKSSKMNGVTIPDYLYKAVYIKGIAPVVYVAPNNDSETYSTMTPDQFKTKFGIEIN